MAHCRFWSVQTFICTSEQYRTKKRQSSWIGPTLAFLTEYETESVVWFTCGWDDLIPLRDQLLRVNFLPVLRLVGEQYQAVRDWQ